MTTRLHSQSDRLFLFALARDGMTSEARQFLRSLLSSNDIDVNASVATLTPIRTASEVRFMFYFKSYRGFYLSNHMFPYIYMCVGKYASNTTNLKICLSPNYSQHTHTRTRTRNIERTHGDGSIASESRRSNRHSEPYG
jgi:hypothetical protein